jgi:hypothetical protein
MSVAGYHTGPRGLFGFLVTSVLGNRGVIPASVLTDEAGNAAPVGTVSDPIYVSGSSGAGSTTGTPTQVASNVAAQTILAANANRKGAGIYYDGAAILYLILSGTTPTSSVYTIKMGSGLATYYEPPANYTGIIRGIWSAAVGSAVVTELT